MIGSFPIVESYTGMTSFPGKNFKRSSLTVLMGDLHLIPFVNVPSYYSVPETQVEIKYDMQRPNAPYFILDHFETLSPYQCFLGELERKPLFSST